MQVLISLTFSLSVAWSRCLQDLAEDWDEIKVVKPRTAQQLMAPFAAWMLALLMSLSGCAPSGPSAALQDAGGDRLQTDVAHAQALLASRWPLPLRAEVVALTDRLSIAAARSGKTLDGANLAFIAGRLRERLWRLDRVATDGREAAELFATAARAATSNELSCSADLRRALLVAEQGANGHQAYREVFLALKRQVAVAQDRDERKDCVARLDRLVRHFEVFRPSGGALLALKSEGRREASEHAAAITGPKLTPTSTSARASASTATPAARLLEGPKGRDVIVVPAADMVGADPVSLTQVQPYSWEQGGRVVLSLTAPARYDVGVLPPDPTAQRGHRVYLDLHNVSRKKGLKPAVEAKGLIKHVRLGKRKNGLRVVVDLAGAAYRRIFYLPDPFRVVIDLGTRLKSRPAIMTAQGKRSVRRVALDPGHGGWDSGAVGPTGLSEKDVVLDIAHRAAPALATELGVETMLTRDTDLFVSLEERTARANAFHADLFISIHCNATEDGHAEGVEIFILDPSREMDAASLRVVARENQAFVRGARPPDPRRLDAQLATIAAGLGLGDTTARSNLLAELLRKSTVSSLQDGYKVRDHGVKRAGFFVLLGAEMPAVLFETAFISNTTDEQRLATANFRQKLADAVVNAVRAYRAGLK